MTSGTRRAARERALALLYEAEARGVTPQLAITLQATDVDPYTRELVSGFTRSAGDIDARIGLHSKGWPIERMPAIDRAILRLAVWELNERTDVPRAVVINEAVELAKRYSTEDSSRFVNGVLSAVMRDLLS